MRLIDADALIEFCAERWIPLNIDAVNMQPTIQPETPCYLGSPCEYQNPDVVISQPEPHEGVFERKRDGVFCSVCHYGWEFITGVPAEVEREYHYCPNCGARMTISTK